MIPTIALIALLAAPTKAPVTLEAEVGKGNFGEFLRVRLVGAEPDVSVITERLAMKVSTAPGKAIISLAFYEEKDKQGRLIVPPASKLSIVKLQPNEVARVQVPYATPPGGDDTTKLLKDAAAGKIELVVEYEMPETWAKRYGVVSGKLSTKATIAK